MTSTADHADPATSTSMPMADGRPALRASDADRERVGQILHHALGAGMLTLAETEERLAVVYAARYLPELEPVTADLPGSQPQPTSRGGGFVTRIAALLRWLLVATAGVRAAAVAFAGRHRVLSLVLAVLVGLAMVSTLVMSGAELFFSPEHDPAEMMGR